MDFLYDNWIVILFIIGAITSFLKKLKESNADKSTRKQPEWKKERDFPPLIHESKPDVNHTGSKPNIEKMKTIETYDVKKEASHRGILNEMMPPLKHTSPSKDRRKVMVSEIEKDEEGIDLTPKKENVVEGVVWAEILGPPRALKSHSIRRIAKK